MHGKLLLLPNLLDENLSPDAFIPASVKPAIESIQGIIAESEKAARRYLRKFISHEQMTKIPIALLNEHTESKQLAGLLDPIKSGQTWGLISDAGLPCIADPGSDLVALANSMGLVVETFVGPCSIILALQLSGFSGQRFSFHGYLPKESQELETKIKELEKQSKIGTQIWIEAPYRGSKMLEILKKTLHPNVCLCVAANLTTEKQKVQSMPISQWQKSSFSLEKEPSIFMIYQH